MKYKILSIDDDANFLKSIKKVLELEDYDVKTISNSQTVIDHIQQNNYDAVLLDVKMPGLNGIDLFDMLIKIIPTIPIIIISGQSSINIAVEFIKQGAFDFIEKPLDPERLNITLKNALEKSELTFVNNVFKNELESKYRMVGNSSFLNSLYEKINMVAPTNAKVLIEGESGTGKELVAWAIHYNSKRNNKPYIKLNCAAIPSELLESELFGHKRGSFTGADKDKKGKFMVADKGTLFLDEIGDMPLPLQSKLLRVLEENEIEVIGDNIPTEIDVRIIAATNKNLITLIEKGKFREDLYHRLNVVKLEIIPLKDRKDDILPIAYHFLNIYAESYNKNVSKLSLQTESAISQLSYQGNIRELKNLIEKMVIFSTSTELGLSDFYNARGNLEESNKFAHLLRTDNPLKNAKANFERLYIIQKLEENNWSITETAKVLNIDRTNLFKKLQKLDIKKQNTD